MKTPHLFPALVAALLTVGILAVGNYRIQQLVDREIYSLADNIFPQKTVGTAVQAAVFHRDDLLPIYGSSELKTQDTFSAKLFFKKHPIGFAVSPVGMDDTTSLAMLQKLASVGSGVRGKKVVVSLSPISYYGRDMVQIETFAGNFSALHAIDTIYSTSLSMELKRGIAARLKIYPSTMRNEMLLRMGVENLLENSPLSTGVYYLALPLGHLQSFVLRLQDRWETYLYVRGLSNTEPTQATDPPEAARTLDWTAIQAASRKESLERTNNNPYGFEKDYWLEYKDKLTNSETALTKGDFAFYSETSAEWTDLDLLLRTLNELGAKSLILSTPLMGQYYDSRGINAEYRSVFYDKLTRIANRHNVPLRCFRERDRDVDFVIDQWGHLNSRGWVYYDQALVDFYNGTLR